MAFGASPGGHTAHNTLHSSVEAAAVLHWYCNGTVLILDWHCANTALVLRWYWTRTALVLHWNCACTTLELWRCTGAALVLQRYCADTTLAVHSYGTSAAPILHWHCAGTMLVMDWCCADTVVSCIGAALELDKYCTGNVLALRKFRGRRARPQHAENIDPGKGTPGAAEDIASSTTWSFLREASESLDTERLEAHRGVPMLRLKHLGVTNPMRTPNRNLVRTPPRRSAMAVVTLGLRLSKLGTQADQ